ncbi:hypothetical protein KM043_017850 [Ampulex compressa]|nr:hypothetical protein KM043_017850 [Ampulex compressa]
MSHWLYAFFPHHPVVTLLAGTYSGKKDIDGRNEITDAVSGFGSPRTLLTGADAITDSQEALSLHRSVRFFWGLLAEAGRGVDRSVAGRTRSGV